MADRRSCGPLPAGTPPTAPASAPRNSRSTGRERSATVRRAQVDGPDTRIPVHLAVPGYARYQDRHAGTLRALSSAPALVSYAHDNLAICDGKYGVDVIYVRQDVIQIAFSAGRTQESDTVTAQDVRDRCVSPPLDEGPRIALRL